MTITYPNGTTLNAVLLSREGNELRTAVLGEEDARVFAWVGDTWVGDTWVGDTWISEEGEPVSIEFAWERPGQANITLESDCLCSKEFASRLISMLLAGFTGDNVLEDMLWVFCAEGERVRANHDQLTVGPHTSALMTPSLTSTLLN